MVLLLLLVFLAGFLAGALAFFVLAIVMHVRKQEAKLDDDFRRETTMADARAQALRGGRFAETPPNVQ